MTRHAKAMRLRTRVVHRLVDRSSWRQRAGPIVLVYHRIAPIRADPQLLSVTPENFAQHLEVVQQEYEAARLSDLVLSNAAGRAPARTVAITFDDGYADNLVKAKPLLQRAAVPATVFVASGYVGGRRLFWWDELERLLLRPGRLPPTVTLKVERESLSWELGEAASYSSAQFRAHAGWTVLDEDDPTPRHGLYRLLCSRLRALEETTRSAAIQELRSLVACENDDDIGRPLTLTELTQLAEGGLIEVGAHTVSHPVLSHLSPNRQREEIGASKRVLEEVLTSQVTSFAYPYGASADFDGTTASIVREAGFEYACTTISGRLNSRTDRFRLPRLVVRNWSGSEFARCLAQDGP